MNVPQVLRENNWSRKSNGVKPTSDGAEKKGAAQRSPDDGPFCWQTKAARRRIRDHFDCTGNVCSALSVYDALTEIASDKQSAVFTTTHAHIAKYSGVSPSTVKRIIAGFDELRLVKIQDSSVGKFQSAEHLHTSFVRSP